MTSRAAFSAPLIALLLFTGCGKRIDNAAHVDGLRAVVEAPPAWVEKSALGTRLWAVEKTFYESRGFMPVWVDGDRTTPHMKELVEQFKYSELHGLDPSRYPIEEFQQLREES